MRDGLIDVLEALENDKGEELQLQLKVFHEHKEEDFDEFAQRFDNIRLELDDVNECFELVKNLVMDSPAERYFLSILQHLVCIRDDALVRPAYYKLVEECVSQIILHKSGCDPDFRATKRFNIDVEPLIEQLVERGRMEDGGSVGSGVQAVTEVRIAQLEAIKSRGGAISSLLVNAANKGITPPPLPAPPGPPPGPPPRRPPALPSQVRPRPKDLPGRPCPLQLGRHLRHHSPSARLSYWRPSWPCPAQ